MMILNQLITLPSSYLVTAGMICVGFYFAFFGGWNAYHWQPTLEYMVQQKIPLAKYLLGLGIIIQTLCGLMLMFGVMAQLAALLLIPFNIVAVFIFHRFWTFSGELKRLNMIIFIGNLTGTLSALLLASAAV